MNTQKCLIVGAGERPVFRKAYNPDEYLIIAADGGYEYLKDAGISPHVWIGDFDSTIREEGVEASGVKQIKLPCEKDDTDTYAAVKYAMEQGYDEFHIYGVTGGRLDHTLANIKLLSHVTSCGKKVYLYSPTEVVTAIENSEITLNGRLKGYVSIFSLTDISEGVSIKGLKYELNNYMMTGTDQLGVSNEFMGRDAVVSVKQGKLLICIQDIN